MLIARSAPECRLFIELHPCACGATELATRHSLRAGAGGALVAVYSGVCPRCDQPRLFEFELDAQTPPLPPAFGGSRPSRIICPGQFALIADREAGSARVDVTTTADRAAIARALAAQEEIIKFIPAGAEAVAPQTFRSAEGQELYARDPARFDGDRLRAVAESYREILARYDASSSP